MPNKKSNDNARCLESMCIIVYYANNAVLKLFQTVRSETQWQ